MSTLPYPPDASLDELLDLAQRKYETVFEPVSVGKQQIELLQIANMASHVDRLVELSREGDKISLPFWARIWPTSILLGYSVQKLDPATGPDLLEVGTGVGLCGLIAAKHGFNVTISDIDDDALLFSRINVLKNGLEERCRVSRIDFTADRIDERFDRIIGSEILYLEDSYRQLVKFLTHHLRPREGAEIIIAKDYRLQAKRFFDLAEREFVIQERIMGFKSQPAPGQATAEPKDRQLSVIYRLTPRKNVQTQ